MSRILNTIKAATLALLLKQATPIVAQEVKDRKTDNKEIKIKSRDKNSYDEEQTYVDGTHEL